MTALCDTGVTPDAGYRRCFTRDVTSALRRVTPRDSDVTHRADVRGGHGTHDYTALHWPGPAQPAAAADASVPQPFITFHRCLATPRNEAEHRSGQCQQLWTLQSFGLFVQSLYKALYKALDSNVQSLGFGRYKAVLEPRPTPEKPSLRLTDTMS